MPFGYCALRAGEDLLGDVLGRVARRRIELLRRRGGVSNRVRALGTVLRGRGDRRAAAPAGKLEGRGTFFAVLGANAVIVVAAGALHDGALRLCRK